MRQQKSELREAPPIDDEASRRRRIEIEHCESAVHELTEAAKLEPPPNCAIADAYSRTVVFFQREAERLRDEEAVAITLAWLESATARLRGGKRTKCSVHLSAKL